MLIGVAAIGFAVYRRKNEVALRGGTGYAAVLRSSHVLRELHCVMRPDLHRVLQNIIIWLVRPYTVRELPGWGRLYAAFVGDYRRDWFWTGAPVKKMRGKIDGWLTDQDLSTNNGRFRFFLGRWSQLEIQTFLSDAISPLDTVIDVGANIGDFSLFACRIARRVLAFEPNPNCREAILHNVLRNGIKNITVFPIGLGDQTETLTLSVATPTSALGTFGQINAPSTQRIEAHVLPGDDALGQERPSLIKIDVEGFETRVITGLAQTLTRCRPIILCEFVRDHLNKCASSPEELRNLIESHGYVGYRLKLVDRSGAYDLAKLDLNEPEFDSVWLHREASIPQGVEAHLTSQACQAR
jgi:FkbM family methyltransferase